ncbi:MAG: DUF5671 domain-containing protein [bacterium]|nr:DUF5671 domain-containing protein [bacterium]MDZ4285455.1 DUF5671 domain-containing protein [Candidatus Sungbacteria bacterium]
MNTQTIKSSPKDIFLHLFNIVTFYMSAVSYITLLMQYIEVLFPDPLNYYLSGTLNSIFWSTSILAIAFPSYLLTSWLMERDFANEPTKRHLNVRKWLVYLTLFVAAVTILGDLITLLFNFLNGELTIPFFLKIIIVLAVAAAVFGYYFWDLKQHDKKSVTKRKQIAWIASAVVLISIVLGFVIAGTPGTQRARRFDDQRVTDLQVMQGQVLDYWTRKAELPSDVSQLENPISGFSVPRDPDTNMPYQYTKTGNLSFELCAEFQLDNSKSSTLQPSYAKYPTAGFREPETWMHSADVTCFTRTIDPDFYKPQPQTDFIPTKIR